MEAMEQDGNQVNDFFLNQMLCAYANARPPQPDRAEVAFRKAMKNNVKLNEFLHTSVRNALGKERAEALLAELGLPVTFERTSASQSGKYANQHGRKSSSTSNTGNNTNNLNKNNVQKSDVAPFLKISEDKRSTSPGGEKQQTKQAASPEPVKGRSNKDDNWRAQA